jgi:hypothetical protein
LCRGTHEHRDLRQATASVRMGGRDEPGHDGRLQLRLRRGA